MLANVTSLICLSSNFSSIFTRKDIRLIRATNKYYFRYVFQNHTFSKNYTQFSKQNYDCFAVLVAKSCLVLNPLVFSTSIISFPPYEFSLDAPLRGSKVSRNPMSDFWFGDPGKCTRKRSIIVFPPFLCTAQYLFLGYLLRSEHQIKNLLMFIFITRNS